ncbi:MULTISPECIES: DUF4411 family protein [Nguyenibacter]|uniref:DUF4411 family protein n=1 Tax=Nguyenibacter vanlangensis TaxID=1216886 RepID=A0ABZ3D9F7_9PROT|nr:DUF4411 family protein [Nguyenibacter sp. L1]WRH89825.1 DUF4411 family protein [Nguyenibacter sp. L1]
MNLYLLDANVLIRAHEDYYPVDRIPQFWEWLLVMAERNRIKTPREIYDEVAPSNGLLAEWLRQQTVKDALVLKETSDLATVQRVVAQGYAPDLNDVELEQIGRDPFLVAAAIMKPNRVVVTKENSKPSVTRSKRKIPDICTTFGVRCINDFVLYRELKFSIK